MKKVEVSADLIRRFAPLTVRNITENEQGEKQTLYTVEGVAAVVGIRTSLGWFDEVIEPGAFTDALASPDLDCRCLKNHDSNLLLARHRANNAENTLELFITTDQHLGFRYTTPNRTWAIDLQNELETGDVDQCSFQFTIEEEKWTWAEPGSTDDDLRTITKVGRLLDVGPVTFPAYRDTSIGIDKEQAKRSIEAARKESKPEQVKPLRRLRLNPLIKSLKED
jgi:HK97 family phage prohead protease